MKKLIVTALLLCIFSTVIAQRQEPRNYHQFTVTKEVAATPVKNQASSGTCWSFSGVAMIESELLRAGKGEHNLSDMWIVRHTYFDKVEKYVRMHGKNELSAGGATHDVINVIREYGIVPAEVYGGLNYGFDNHNHKEFDEIIKAYADAVVANKAKMLSTAWKEGLNGILDAYLGKVPEKFTYKGKEYTPKSYAAALGLDMNDYIDISSYTHHPFYTQFALEVPDNWVWGLSYNLPMDELMAVIENSLEKGYSVCWAADVSEPGFIYNKGIAFVPSDMLETEEGTEQAKWVAMSQQQKTAAINRMLEGPIKEKIATQQDRQLAFDNYETTDDHGMLITGMATDQDGNKYFKVKNSWGTNQLYEGYFYASFPYVAYKTMNISVNKNSLPKEIANKLGIK